MQPLRSYQLAVSFYRRAMNIRLPVHLRNQFRRASSSIALNLHEGYGKPTMKDRIRFFSIAMGSIRECQAVMELEPRSFDATSKGMLDHLAASVFKLIRNSPGFP
jgi:four helix bundle protein